MKSDQMMTLTRKDGDKGKKEMGEGGKKSYDLTGGHRWVPGQERGKGL